MSVTDDLARLTTKRLPADWTELDQRAVDTIRVLAADAVEKCGSGHPGTAMSLAPTAYALFQRVMRHDPADPDWVGRDRFVLSAGHSSLTLYLQLFLSGYGLELDDIKSLRTWDSKTPGHPEYWHTPGVETTTGPLGQGLANGVGMAIAARRERGLLDPEAAPGESPFDHQIYVIASDGDIEEGVTSEASSLAGTQQLGNLTVIYDANEISIEDDTKIALSEDTAKRYEAYGWHVITVDGGEDVSSILDALDAAKGKPDQPTLIVLRTVIGYPAPNKMNSGKAHGAALGTEELPSWEPAEKGVATRKASAEVLAHLADVLPELWGGSADLAESNNTTMKGAESFGPESISTGTWSANPYGRTLHFGIREHAMGSILNGIALHGGTRPYGGTFLVFSDYMRPAVRLAALMHQPVIYVWTHDSIGLGEDGPTHQPVEHLSSLRAIPGLAIARPADANETAAAWKAALERSDGPTGLALTRQGVPTLEGTDPEGVSRGGYVLAEASSGEPAVVLIATGSEVQLAVAAKKVLESEGEATRVVSMPCVEWFDAQDESYRRAVLPPAVRARVVVEAGIAQCWHRFAGAAGEIVSLERFGASADHQTLFTEFGFTAEAVAEAARRALRTTRSS